MERDLNDIVMAWVEGIKQLSGGVAPTRISIPKVVLDDFLEARKKTQRFAVMQRGVGATKLAYQHGPDCIEILGE